MNRFLICISIFLFQFTNVQAFSQEQIKLMKEIQQACRTKTNSLEKTICKSEYRVKLVEEKCGRSADGLVEGSIVQGVVKCGASSPKPSKKPSKKAAKKIAIDVETKPSPGKAACAYSTEYACEAYDFRMSRCKSSSKEHCQELSHKFALKAQVHEELGDAGIAVYDRCLNMRDTSPDECAKFAKFYIDEQKKNEEVATTNQECSEFAVGERNVSCHGFEYKRVDSDLADISRRVGKDVERSIATRSSRGSDGRRSQTQ